jgi:hypothetical protein
LAAAAVAVAAAAAAAAREEGVDGDVGACWRRRGMEWELQRAWCTSKASTKSFRSRMKALRGRRFMYPTRADSSWKRSAAAAAEAERSNTIEVGDVKAKLPMLRLRVFRRWVKKEEEEEEEMVLLALLVIDVESARALALSSTP